MIGGAVVLGIHDRRTLPTPTPVVQKVDYYSTVEVTREVTREVPVTVEVIHYWTVAPAIQREADDATPTHQPTSAAPLWTPTPTPGKQIGRG
jgi:hypothetical protein